MVEVVPVPITGTGPPFITHIPVDGRLCSTTEPVFVVQFGCVIAPTVGAPGVPGEALMCTLAEGAEIHEPLFTTNV